VELIRTAKEHVRSAAGKVRIAQICLKHVGSDSKEYMDAVNEFKRLRRLEERLEKRQLEEE
jgi:hypothetical protein